MKPHTPFLKGVLTLTICICFLTPMAWGGETPIKIGFVGDFSSVSSSYMKNAYAVAQFAMETFNAQGGLLGRSIEMVKRDGGNDPDRHYRHVVDLVSQGGVVAVFGGASTPCVLKASEACRELKIPYLVSCGNSQSIVVENGHPFVFMFQPNTRMESMGFSIFASLMPWQRYAWIGPDYVWGRGVLGFFKHYFKAIGSPITWTTEVWYPLGTSEYEGAIEEIIAGKPEALVVAIWGEDLRHFMQQANARALFDGMAAFGWFSIITDSDERLLPEGVWKISRAPFSYLSEKFPQPRAFVAALQAKYHLYPLDFSICCYDSLLAWRQAVENTGSATPEDVAEALKGLSFTGLRGDSVIRAVDGQMDCPIFFGRLTYGSDYPVPTIDSVIEIPAAKTWLSEDEVAAVRAEKQGNHK